MKILLLLAFLTSTALAQKAEERTYRIIFLKGSSSAPKSLYLYDGKKSQQVNLPRMNFSKVYNLSPEALSVGLTSSVVTEPSEIPVGMPTAKIAAGMKDFYLILINDPTNKVAPVKIKVINADKDKIKKGQMLWLNLTKNTVGGMVGSEKLLIKPSSRLVLDPPAKSTGSYPVKLYYRMPKVEQIYPLCKSKWGYDSRSRTVAMIFHERGRRAPRIMVFKDYRVPKKKDP